VGVTRERTRARYAATFLIFALVLCAPLLPAQAHFPAADAHPIGTPVAIILEFGDQYLGGDELYDAKITVLRVVRGEKAWGMIKAASASNPAPKAGWDYVLARVQFEFATRTSPSHFNYAIDPSQFTVATAEGAEFDPPALVEQLKPGLSGTIKPGDAMEGWLAFAVPHNLERPLMIFREDVGEVIHRGGGTWFQLYEGSAARR
jgi:uncharacterized protein DUF4352